MGPGRRSSRAACGLLYLALVGVALLLSACEEFPLDLPQPKPGPRVVLPPEPPIVIPPLPQPPVVVPPQPQPPIVIPPQPQPPQPPIVIPPTEPVVVQPPEPLPVWEDVVNFDPDLVQAQPIGGRWFVMAGNLTLLGFEADEAGARRAAEVIRSYRMNAQCSIGRPVPLMQYYLVNGQPPMGPMPGEVAIPFDPARLEVVQVNDRWMIVHGTMWLVDFGPAEAEARAALALIQRRGFTHLCFVGQPQPAMMYFRAGEPAVAAPYVQATLVADPPLYAGPLPAILGFRGQITAGQPCDVQYTFIRSDGVPGPVYTMRFDQPGVAEVNTSLTLGDACAGWMALRILSPVTTQSSPAPFEVRPEAQAVVRATVIAEPAVYVGPRPATITFRGIISVGQPCEVQYAFVRSNGALGPVQTLRFDRRGRQMVSDTWTLFRDGVGWGAIHIFSPVETDSNQAPFEVRFGGQTGVQATLAADPALYCGPLPATVNFRGLIAVGQPCEVRYVFVRSDGTASPEQRLLFPRPGVQEVSTSWVVPQEGTGWQAIRVLSPVALDSEPAAFEVRSAAQPHVAAALLAEPTLHPGPLPATVQFRGTIAAGQPCEVTYAFVRSTGEASTVRTLRFPRRGIREVTDAWTLPANYVGWEAIRILSPVQVDSNQAAFQVQAAPQPSIQATLAAEPPQYTGKLPVTIQFKGTLAAGQPGEVAYTFIRSDNKVGPVYRVRFKAPGVHPVQSQWTIQQDYAGWQAIRILSPVVVESNPAAFVVKSIAPPTVRATLAAEPALHTGPLPATIHFKGLITVDRACEVKYAFVRSDNTSTPFRTLRFDGPGARQVGTSLTLTENHKGWQAIRIAEPVAAVSNRADFEVRTQPEAKILATLNAQPPKYVGAGPATITMKGTIQANQACKVRYTIVRSDNAPSRADWVTFDGPGAKEVETSWRFTQDFTGWGVLRIIEPVKAESNQAAFRVNIAEAPKLHATLAAEPPKYAGPAPATVQFKGTIRASQACDVQYQFVRSDGTSSAVQALRFAGPGVAPVAESRQFAADAKGWEQVRILAPVPAESNKADFQVDIAEALKLNATLAAEPPKYAGPAPATVQFKGTIRASQACDVQYQFVRSDGTSSAVQALRFAGPGVAPVAESRQFAADAKGWEQVRILAPVPEESNKAGFQVDIAQALKVNATLKAEPPKYTGPGPATITMKGTIRADQACKVRYTIVRSDNAPSRADWVTFDGPGTQEVETAWQFTRDFTGWSVLRILSPVQVESNQAAFQVDIAAPKVQVEVDLSVDPPMYGGPAPATIVFKGVIKVTQPCTVKYAFARSDGAPTAAKSLQFDAPGSQEVEIPWRFTKDFKGWGQLRVLSPQAVESAKVPFTVDIRDKPEAARLHLTLAADPPSYTGKLPVDIRFNGTIKADQACSVRYVFVRSDKTTVGPHVLEFTGPGEKAVTDTWTVPGNLTGWEMIRVESPVKASSEKADFKVRKGGP